MAKQRGKHKGDSSSVVALGNLQKRVAELQELNAETFKRTEKATEMFHTLAQDVVGALSQVQREKDEHAAKESQFQRERQQLVAERDALADQVATANTTMRNHNGDTRPPPPPTTPSLPPIPIMVADVTPAAPPPQPTDKDLICTLLAMGYPRASIDIALEAFAEETEQVSPGYVIDWIEMHVHELEAESQRVKKEKLEVDKKKETKERATRKKAAREAEKARKAEEERIRIAEEERVRQAEEKQRRDAKLEKDLLVKAHEETCARQEQARKERESKASIVNDRSSPTGSTSGAVDAKASKADTKSSLDSISTQLRKTKLSGQTAIVSNNKTRTATSNVDPGKLSSYLYAPTNSSVHDPVQEPAVTAQPETAKAASSSKTRSEVSPIFGLLQDTETVGMARSLLSLQDKCARLKKEDNGICNEKQTHEKRVAALVVKEAGLEPELTLRIAKIETVKKNALERQERSNKWSRSLPVLEAKIAALENMPSFAHLRQDLETFRDARDTIAYAVKQEKQAPQRIIAINAEITEKRSRVQKKIKHLHESKESWETYEADIAQLRAYESGLDEELANEIYHTKAEVARAQGERKSLDLSQEYVQKKLASLEDLPLSSAKKKESLEGFKQSRDVLQKATYEASTYKARIEEAKGESLRHRGLLKNDIREEEERLEDVNSKLRNKRKEIENTRDEIRKVHPDVKDDPRFDINDSRDEQGQTFLMIAVQNNDIETARLCFGLHARPDAKCSSSELTAMFFARYFNLDDMVALIALQPHGDSEPGDPTWDSLFATSVKPRHPIDWETQLRIAEKAAMPADTTLSSVQSNPEENSPGADYDWKTDTSCFAASLLAPSKAHFRRVVLLEKRVNEWFVEADEAAKSEFVGFLRRLQHATPVTCHRRFIVGVKREKQFEVLCAELGASAASGGWVGSDSAVVFYSPFVESEIQGVAKVGVLLWAVSVESEAWKYRSLIEGAEFRRHKVLYPNDRYPEHREDVLELGKDMHLLDLMGTSIFTGKAMDLLSLDVDAGALEHLGQDGSTPKKRLLDHEEQLEQALFRPSETEARESDGLLFRANLSASIHGGAGTGKTVTLIRKVASEDAYKRILVVSRLSRLISFVKSEVEVERAEAKRGARNVVFSTYDELVTLLARTVNPSEESERRAFSVFTQVQFGDTTGTGAASSVSFVKDFYGTFLGDGERKIMENNSLHPITLWSALRVIKSSVTCSQTKAALKKEEYLGLPPSFGLTSAQRAVVYDLYVRYAEWLACGAFKWDEADRVLYIFRWGESVFTDPEFISWEERARKRGEVQLLDENGLPIAPFFYDMVCVDEAQDFSQLDLALFIRMSSGLRSLFLGSDPAQSVELGVRMRAGTVNGVFHSCLPSHKANIQVKNVLQDIRLQTNYRTHARNMEIAKAVRKILMRSFGVPGNDENALMEGPMPEALCLQGVKDLGDAKTFRGGNVVFVAPDELLPKLRSAFLQYGIKNDVFGVREAKGLEFASVAVIGFFAFFEERGCSRQWENALRWLHSGLGVTATESAESVQGKRLEQCDYILSSPEVEDQAMLLYTAMTRAKGNLYFIEVKEQVKSKKKVGLADFAFRQFKLLRLLKTVKSIDAGEVDMNPQEHKARGVLLVVQAINMSRNSETTARIKQKFAEAMDRFQPDKGNDMHLLDQCNKHLNAILMKRALVDTLKTTFFNNAQGAYDLVGRFHDVLQFEEQVAKFFRLCANDSFLVDEIQETRVLIEDVFYDTPYEHRFSNICEQVKKFESG